MGIWALLTGLPAMIREFIGWKRQRDLMDAGAAQADVQGKKELIEDVVEDRLRDAIIDSDPVERERLLRQFRDPKG